MRERNGEKIKGVKREIERRKGVEGTRRVTREREREGKA